MPGDEYLDRALDYHNRMNFRDTPETYRVVTDGKFTGWGDVEERPGTIGTHWVTILAENFDYLASAEHLAQRLCESMRRTVWAETEDQNPEQKGAYCFDADSGRAILEE